MATKLPSHGHYQAQDLARFRCDVVQRGLLFAIKETLRLGEQPWSNWATLRAHALEQEPYDAECAIVLADLRLDSESADCVLMEVIELGLQQVRWAREWRDSLVQARPDLVQQLAGRGSWLFNLFDDTNPRAIQVAQQDTWGDLWVTALQRWAHPEGRGLLLLDQNGHLREEEVLGLVFVTRMTLNLDGGLGGRGLWAIKLLDRLVGPGVIGAHGPSEPFSRVLRADVRRRVLTVNGKHSVILGEDNAIPERRM